MNKRTKKKIAKRIINKIGTEQTLTYFERKYFIKFFWTPLRKEVIRIGEQLKAEENLEIQSMKGQINELNIAEVTPVEEPSKWNKLKGRMKGWFGK